MSFYVGRSRKWIDYETELHSRRFVKTRIRMAPVNKVTTSMLLKQDAYGHAPPSLVQIFANPRVAEIPA